MPPNAVLCRLAALPRPISPRRMSGLGVALGVDCVKNISSSTSVEISRWSDGREMYIQ
jgi:hypothetical protein